jgi:glycosyltransferase involved in cell wall biosynthesis
MNQTHQPVVVGGHAGPAEQTPLKGDGRQARTARVIVDRDGALNVGLVVGRPLAPAYEGLRCGVRDYAIRLAQALCDVGVNARIVAPPEWGLHGAAAFVRALRAERLDILHLQYPAVGFGPSLVPHFLGMVSAARGFVVTLQRAANKLFAATADSLIFTTDYEARAYAAGPGCKIIPIGSNVPVHPQERQRDTTVLYFGQIRPNKGIEDFIELATLSASAGEPFRFAVIGTAPPKRVDYCAALRARAPSDLDWMADVPLEQVARAMAGAFAAVLPFPDGAGLRRGSLLAALLNGLPVVTKFGPSTTDELRSVLFQAPTVEAALDQLRALRAAPELARQRAAAGRALVQRFDWTTIAHRHDDVYRDILQRKSDRPRTE